MKGIRKRLYSIPEVGELARDVDDSLSALSTIASMAVVEARGTFAQPMYVSMPTQPKIVAALRVTPDDDVQTAVTIGGTSFWYDPKNKRAVITNISGCVLGTAYRYTYLVVS